MPDVKTEAQTYFVNQCRYVKNGKLDRDDPQSPSAWSDICNGHMEFYKALECSALKEQEIAGTIAPGGLFEVIQVSHFQFWTKKGWTIEHRMVKREITQVETVLEPDMVEAPTREK